MGTTAWVITALYAVLTIIGVAVGLIIFRSTRVGFRVETAGRETIERREGYWGVASIVFLTILLAGTIFQIPYWKDNSDASVQQRLSIIGRQFAWTVNPPRVKAGM